eukprot:CAMPEP_0175065062 /NCGR_PEP_ID=MMETSP0052_2-20121109/15696_1 /TAXON_ID=51329 ORGANISM="Polytomella parva, Strain SAG 63-3" /NCGR_SAMPLE_ID=MMETSP0052_2 /ASSEMBLY_ACC=CAM_ASM_000194 /LENGTH=434 /DNA_ID=CAMNT_0016331515 /DNA_START=148 /DNA_END=1452 /DNA_ORIENTATION=+
MGDIIEDKSLTFYDLNNTEKLYHKKIFGAETVRVQPTTNRLVLLDQYGNLWLSRRPITDVVSNSSSASIAATLGSDLDFMGYLGPGRPLGFGFGISDPNQVYICDSSKGLIGFYLGSNEITVLSNAVSADSSLDPGSHVTFANDLVVTQEEWNHTTTEVIYFTASTDIPVRLSGSTLNDFGQIAGRKYNKTFPSYYNTFETYLRTLTAGDSTGRLLKYNVRTKQTHVLVNNLAFPNGLAMSSDKSYLVVVETNRLRVLRYWISGPKSGSWDVFVDHLPGFPDGITLVSGSKSIDDPEDHGSSDQYVVTLGGPTTRSIKALMWPGVRWALFHLPTWARPKVPTIGAIVKIQARRRGNAWGDRTGEGEGEKGVKGEGEGSEETKGTPMMMSRVMIDGRKGEEGVAGISSVAEALGGKVLIFGHVKEDYVSLVRMTE